MIRERTKVASKWGQTEKRFRECILKQAVRLKINKGHSDCYPHFLKGIADTSRYFFLWHFSSCNPSLQSWATFNQVSHSGEGRGGGCVNAHARSLPAFPPFHAGKFCVKCPAGPVHTDYHVRGTPGRCALWSSWEAECGSTALCLWGGLFH